MHHLTYSAIVPSFPSLERMLMTYEPKLSESETLLPFKSCASLQQFFCVGAAVVMWLCYYSPLTFLKLIMIMRCSFVAFSKEKKKKRTTRRDRHGRSRVKKCKKMQLFYSLK